jgi:hypothetical protein
MKKVIPKIPEYLEEGLITPKKKKGKETYQRFNVTHDFIPEAKDLEFGKSYTIIMKVKVVGLSISRFSNETEFEVHEYDIKGKKDKSEEQYKK